MREVLSKQRADWRFHQEAVFAWIPTITCVSRQAIFAGKLPIYFPNSIHATDKDGHGWEQFWADHGLNPAQVSYARNLGDEASLAWVEELTSSPAARILGLVVDKVDKIMHGMELGTAGMHEQVRLWAEQGFMARLLDLLLASGFAVCLTSDHGNIEATGIGRPSEGALADQRGERVRVYVDPLLRARVKERYPTALEWPPVGLPDNFLPLLAPGRGAFIREGERTVAHGGASLEEVVVPLIRIEKGDS